MAQLKEQIEAHESALDATNTEFQAALDLLRRNGELMVKVIQQLHDVNINLEKGCDRIAGVFDKYIQGVRT